VRIGATNVNTVASDKDRCCREKNIPARATKLKMTENCPNDHVGHVTLRHLGVLAIPEHPSDRAMGLGFSAST